MLSIVNKEISHTALKALEKQGTVLQFETQGITYNAIQNHPDIFLFQLNNTTAIAAPNTPENIQDDLNLKGFNIILGEAPVGLDYPRTAFYNAVRTPLYLIHNSSITDSVIKQNSTDVITLNIRQGYARCNLVALPNNSFMTSDYGILKTLKNEELPVLFINPEPILLKDFPHGFFGGCCGVSKKYFFFNGALKYFTEKKEIEKFVNESQLELIELSSEKPVDIGSILIFE